MRTEFCSLKTKDAMAGEAPCTIAMD
jgi:hypothetical protein